MLRNFPILRRARTSAVVFLFIWSLLGAGNADAARIVKGNETWSGKIVLDGEVQVPPGAVLTLQPGAELRFPEGSTFSVEGRLVAKGTAARPITLRPVSGDKPGSWQGLSIHSGGAKIELAHLLVEGAAQALVVTESAVSLTDSTLRSGVKGVVTGIGARLTLDRVKLADMSEGGIEASVRSQVEITGCRFEKMAGFGIQAGQQAAVRVRDNHITGAKFGILVTGNFPPMEGNVLERCELAIGIAQAGPGAVVRGNRISGGKVGISCQQFASPTIEKNTITDCEEGLACVQGSSPLIQKNRFAKNRRAIACVQMCNPQIMRNDFVDNDVAAYLHLSSYAIFQENNFEGSRLHVELDNMSYDWEVRAGKKPTRNREKQQEVFLQREKQQEVSMPRGSEPSGKGRVEVDSEGYVNAKGNYWGAKTTAEMTAKGANANISAFQDAFDVPTRSYEGWPGEYRQDRIRYEGWKLQRIPGTGP